MNIDLENLFFFLYIHWMLASPWKRVEVETSMEKETCRVETDRGVVFK